MKKFIIKILISAAIVFLIYLFTGFLADGSTDGYYLRFTSPKQNSLILGTSRAAQGLLPSVFDSVLTGYLPDKGMYDFAFTDIHSRYGPVYLKAILKKINPEVKNGVYILAVDPWSVSSDTSNPNNTDKFIENSLSLAKVKSFTSSPNYEYLIKCYPANWGSIILNRIQNTLYNKFPAHFTWSYLHDDGWLEVNIPMDSTSMAKRIAEKVKEYSDFSTIRSISSVRLNYLEKTISTLKMHGHVFLVRLPISKQMLEVERNYLPDFDYIISNIASKYQIPYINLIDESTKYVYTDGNHLYKSCGKEVSVEVARIIKANMNSN